MTTTEKELVQDFLTMCQHTHAEEMPTYLEMKDFLENNSNEPLAKYQVVEMISHLDNTHCYETQIFDELQEYKQNMK